jgi:hypothetical protein
MARNEIGMQVGFDHPLDPQRVGGRIGEIDTDVACRKTSGLLLAPSEQRYYNYTTNRL